ncbi:hypothetical protein M8J77_023261 [Diaphorina citri]|nr:hypothetical protein M8J77_002194 [Diaphorina citri]KAI5726051.1 hypothetical protein M8J77_023261 [Diaphorina citri]
MYISYLCDFAIMFADFAIMFADLAIMFADLAILFADLAIMVADLAIMFADLAIMFADSRPESTFWIFGKPTYEYCMPTVKYRTFATYLKLLTRD